MRKILSSIAIVATAIFPFARVSGEGAAFMPPDSIAPRDSASGAEAYTAAVCAAMQAAAADSADRYTRLTIADYERVAAELGIEVATIRAVSDIEAGKTHKGFFEAGKPVINFDRTIFTSRLRRSGKNVARARKQHPGEWRLTASLPWNPRFGECSRLAALIGGDAKWNRSMNLHG